MRHKAQRQRYDAVLLAVSLAVLLVVVATAAVRAVHPRPPPRLSDIQLLPPQGYEAPPAAAPGAVRLGVVCMTKDPLAFQTWLRHHQDVGVCHYFLCIEDTPSLFPLVQSAEWSSSVTTTYATGVQSYFSQMSRQERHVNRSIVAARQRGITHLAHIDDDELLYCPSGQSALHDYLATGSGACLHLRNIEAVYSHSDCVNPFRSTQWFCVRPTDFTAYTNGKSIGVLARASVRARGPHFFTGSVSEIPTHVAVVVHYESSCLHKWQRKFAAYAADSPTACSDGEIPFRFYCDSMDAVSRSDRAATWARWKTKPVLGDGMVALQVLSDRVADHE